MISLRRGVEEAAKTERRSLTESSRNGKSIQTTSMNLRKVKALMEAEKEISKTARDNVVLRSSLQPKSQERQREQIKEESQETARNLNRKIP